MKISKLTKSYDSKVVLRLPKMDFKKSRIYAVIGSNGSGKSTMAKILAGATDADARNCIFPETGERIRYLPQKSYSFRLKARRSILIGGNDAERADYLARELLLAGLLNQKGHRLSGGESARVALARVLMDSCDMLILDEPTAAMDMESTLAAERLVLEYRNKFACAVLWITHSITQAERTADELIFLNEGRIMETGEISDTLTAPKSEALRNFLDFYRLS